MATSIEYSLGPHTFARGWYVIAESHELTERPLALRFFDQDFALYRGESGQLVLLDAHCPHMQCHIAASDTVRGSAVYSGLVGLIVIRALLSLHRSTVCMGAKCPFALRWARERNSSCFFGGRHGNDKHRAKSTALAQRI